jgi:uncharacterized repeat protein (TIGR03833 family)
MPSREYLREQQEIMKDRLIKDQYPHSTPEKDGRQRKNIRAGEYVRIELKKDQRSGTLTTGRVREILTGSATHPHGIKVRLEDGNVGRVRYIGSPDLQE